jgi:hypothetical protein
MGYLGTFESLLELEQGLSTLVVNTFDFSMAGISTCLTPWSYWCITANDNTNIIEVVVIWAKVTAIAATRNMTIVVTTARTTDVDSINNWSGHDSVGCLLTTDELAHGNLNLNEI